MPLKKIKDELFYLKESLFLIWVYPKMNLEKVDYDAYWKVKRGGEIGRLSSWQKDRAEIISRIIKSQSSVLDVACGDGSILTYIDNKVKLGKKYGADSSDFALDFAKKQNIETFKINLDSVNSLFTLPDVDHVLLLEILEHITNPEEVLKVLLNKTKKSLFFSIPNTGYFVHRIRLLTGKFPLQWRVHPSEHVRFWTYQDLVWWLDELGYKGRYRVYFYKGFPLLNKIWPSLFALGFVVELKKGI